MTLRRITLRLARNENFPNGDDKQGYVLVAPLTGDGHIDMDEWREHRDECTVIRFHPDPAEHADGWLTHRGSQWRFRYDEEDEGPDEAGYKLDEHRFTVGEYVTFAHHGDEPLTYVVTEIVKV